MKPLILRVHEQLRTCTQYGTSANVRLAKMLWPLTAAFSHTSQSAFCLTLRFPPAASSECFVTLNSIAHMECFASFWWYVEERERGRRRRRTGQVKAGGDGKRDAKHKGEDACTSCLNWGSLSWLKHSGGWNVPTLQGFFPQQNLQFQQAERRPSMEHCSSDLWLCCAAL